jgi:putative transposase
MKEVGNADRQEVGGRPQQSSGELASAVSTTRARDAALSSMKTLQKFSSVHGQVHNHFNQERDLVTPSRGARLSGALSRLECRLRVGVLH